MYNIFQILFQSAILESREQADMHGGPRGTINCIKNNRINFNQQRCMDCVCV